MNRPRIVIAGAGAVGAYIGGLLAAAGRDVLDRMAGLDALYPALEAGEGAEAAADGGALSVAAGWIEIIALRQKK